jgi:DNA-binding CsgD family transcriptional regulator
MAATAPSALIELIYRSVVSDGEGARADLAASLGKVFSAESCGLYVTDKASGACTVLATSENFSATSAAAYEDYYHHVDEWSQRAASSTVGRPFLSQDLMAEREARNTEIYCDYARPIGVFHIVGAVVPTPTHLIGLGIHRPEKAKAFTEVDRSLMAELVPHLVQAVDLAAKFGQLRVPATQETCERVLARLSLAALDAVGLGLVLLDDAGFVRHLTPQAERFIQRQSGLRLHHRRLEIANPVAQARFATLLDGVLRKNLAGGLVPLARELERTRAPALQVCPLPPDLVSEIEEPMALVLLGGSNEREIPLPMLMDLFGFTRSEAMLVQGLVEGQTLQAYSAEIGIGLETARTHLKRIYAKTGYDRQADLVRAVISHPLLGLSSCFSE